jgi:energy-coupling factor transport system permease protein
MMMSIALRFIPTLIEETDKIMSAQKARGADFESGGLFKRARALLPFSCRFSSARSGARTSSPLRWSAAVTTAARENEAEEPALRAADILAFVFGAAFLAAIFTLGAFGL